MSELLRVLIVEDSVDDTFFIVRELQRGGFHVEFERVETATSMQAALDTRVWDLVISDYSMPQFGGPAALTLFLHHGIDVPFIIVSGAMGEELAVEMLKAGAHNYVMKDNLSRLVPAVRQELRAALERRVRRQTETTAAFLASLVESCEDAIVGNTLDGTVVSWNVGAERLYGYTAPEIVGRSVSLLIPQFRPQELPELLEKIKQGEHIEHFETVRMHKDGGARQVSLTISPIKDASGRVIGSSTVARDISQRKQEESERLALIQDLTSALARANGLKESFSA
jgi:PAS domain S-box-containing protein